MQIHLSPRHLVLTGAINSYVVNKLATLDHKDHQIIAVHAVLVHDESKKKGSYVAKVHLAVPGPDIHVEDRADDLYAAVDLVVAKLFRQLRKRKTRRVTSKKHKAQQASERRKLGV